MKPLLIRDYRPDYNNRPSYSISFIPVVNRTSVLLYCELVHILFLQTHRETDSGSLPRQHPRVKSAPLCMNPLHPW
jgi:hypothetical protein